MAKNGPILLQFISILFFLVCLISAESQHSFQQSSQETAKKLASLHSSGYLRSTSTSKSTLQFPTYKNQSFVCFKSEQECKDQTSECGTADSSSGNITQTLSENSSKCIQAGSDCWRCQCAYGRSGRSCQIRSHVQSFWMVLVSVLLLVISAIGGAGVVLSAASGS